MEDRHVSGCYSIAEMQSKPLYGGEPMDGGMVSQGKGKMAMSDESITHTSDAPRHVGQYSEYKR